MNTSVPPTAALPIAACPHCKPFDGLAPRPNTANGAQYWVFCPECGMHGPCGVGEIHAIENWNAVVGRAPAVQATADEDLIDALRSIPTCGDRGDLVWFSEIEKILSRHSAVSPKAAAEGPRDIKRLVDRFLGWKLPENFNPDAGISFKKTFNDHFPVPMKHEPTGTNLFDATQAEAMLRYVLETPAAVSGKQEKER